MEISVGQRVRIARERAGIEIADMADRLGMNRNTYSQRERGGSPFRITELHQVAEICGVTIHDLIG